MIDSSIESSSDQLNFAFGSNMSERQMRARCPSAKKIGVAYLPAHKLVFNRKGSYRTGGVASVSPTGNPSDRVFGVVWAISDHDSQLLAEIEDPNAYKQTAIRVVGNNGVAIECHAYIAIPQAEYVAPDREYLGIILAAAHAEGLPPDYIKLISRFQDTARAD